MKPNWTFLIFGASVLAGAIGLGLALSPYDGPAAGYVVAFAMEGIRAGLVFVNVQIRKLDPDQYRVILWLAVLITAMQSATIAAHTGWDYWSAKFFAAQTISIALLIGEYAVAVWLSGPSNDIIKVAALRNRVAELEQAETDLAAARSELAKSQAANASMSNVAKLAAALAGRSITINGIRQAVCECGTISANESNANRQVNCRCGRPFNYG